MALVQSHKNLETEPIFDKGVIRKVFKEGKATFYEIELINRTGFFAKVRALGSGFGPFKIERCYPKNCPVAIGYIGIAREPFILDVYASDDKQYIANSDEGSFVKEGEIKISNIEGTSLHLKANGDFILENSNRGKIEQHLETLTFSTPSIQIALQEDGKLQISGNELAIETNRQLFMGKHFLVKTDSSEIEDQARIEAKDGVASLTGSKGILISSGPAATAIDGEFFIFVNTPAHQQFEKGVTIVAGEEGAEKWLKHREGNITIGIKKDIQAGIDGKIRFNIKKDEDEKIEIDGEEQDNPDYEKSIVVRTDGHIEIAAINQEKKGQEMHNYTNLFKVAKDDKEGTYTGTPSPDAPETGSSPGTPMVEPASKYLSLMNLLEQLITTLQTWADTHIHTGNHGAPTPNLIPLSPQLKAIFDTFKETIKSETTKIQ